MPEVLYYLKRLGRAPSGVDEYICGKAPIIGRDLIFIVFKLYVFYGGFGSYLYAIFLCLFGEEVYYAL